MIILFLNKTKETNLSLLPPLDKLKIPVIGSPLFIISNPDLVIAQCKAGVIGSFPCLNAREGEGEPNMLEIWLKKICLLYTSPSPRDQRGSRMPSCA